MEKKQFQVESNGLFELILNSIYTHKEVLLRELISNTSDAIDKIYYKTLTDDSLTFEKDSYYIRIDTNKENRLLKVIDTGIGMTREELENNLGIIAESGSFAFKSENEIKDGHDIIGQFGVGFYAAFMVADGVTVTSRSLHSDEYYQWQSEGTEGYTIMPAEKADVGTEIVLELKDNTEEEEYDEYLDEQHI